MKKVTVDAYLKNAAKLCLFPVDIVDRTISVHESEMEAANDDLSVQHLINQHNFRIQYASMPGMRKPIIPEFHTRIKTEKQEPNAEWIGKVYEVANDGARLECIKATGQKDPVCELRYTNRDKGNITKTVRELKSLLGFNLWLLIENGS